MLHTCVRKTIGIVLLFAVPPATAEEATILAKLKQSTSHLVIAEVAPSPVDGLYRVEVQDQGAVFYVTADGSHLVAGDMYELTSDGLTNITEVGREVKRRSLLASLPLGDQIVFAPIDEPQATISVFTDVDCSYSRKFHQNVGELNDHGIEVRYLAYPRAGRHSDTYKKMVWAWCADDPHLALTALKRGNDIPPASCADPVGEQAALAEAMDVEGTPTMITSDGRKIAGYLPPLDLLRKLDIPPPESPVPTSPQ